MYRVMQTTAAFTPLPQAGEDFENLVWAQTDSMGVLGCVFSLLNWFSGFSVSFAGAKTADVSPILMR